MLLYLLCNAATAADNDDDDDVLFQLDVNGECETKYVIKPEPSVDYSSVSNMVVAKVKNLDKCITRNSMEHGIFAGLPHYSSEKVCVCCRLQLFPLMSKIYLVEQMRAENVYREKNTWREIDRKIVGIKELKLCSQQVENGSQVFCGITADFLCLSCILSFVINQFNHRQIRSITYKTPHKHIPNVALVCENATLVKQQSEKTF